MYDRKLEGIFVSIFSLKSVKIVAIATNIILLAFFTISSDYGNLTLLISGNIAVASKLMIMNNDWRGWALGGVSVALSTVAVVMAGLWVCIIINSVLLAMSLWGANEWRKHSLH